MCHLGDIPDTEYEIKAHRKMKKMNIYNVMQPTCWGSLSYCCGLKKKCQIRDNVMKKLNMSKFEYVGLKTDFDKTIQNTRNDNGKTD